MRSLSKPVRPPRAGVVDRAVIVRTDAGVRRVAGMAKSVDVVTDTVERPEYPAPDASDRLRT